jgi:hypothetical protein
MHDEIISVFPSFIGPGFACIFLFYQSSERRFDWRFWIVLGCDLLGMLLLVTSIALAGSSLFFITFSWITIFAALLKRIFLGKDQTRYQWFALVFMTMGLCASAAGADMDYGIKVFYGILVNFYFFRNCIIYLTFLITPRLVSAPLLYIQYTTSLVI